MIDKNFINNAIIIRNEFISLIKSLEKYETEAKNLSVFYNKIANEMSAYKESLDQINDVQKIQKYLLGKMNELEVESQKLSSKITPINDRIEKLRKEEEILYNKIKGKYPKLSDDEIKKELSKHIKE